jgi:hypothetical protein
MLDSRTEKLALDLENVANHCTGATDEIGKYLANNTHRTIQQTFMRIIVSFIRESARNEGANRYDARNEATVKLCKEIVNHLDAKDSDGLNYTYLPYI